jgi:Fe-S-cluster containining protein
MARNAVETQTVRVLDREALIDAVTLHTCLHNCTGSSGIAAGCCTLGSRSYIIGPIPDTADLLGRISERWGRPVPYDEVFIDYEEGSALFPDNSEWQRKVCYPALRVRTDDPSLPCMFLSDENLCSIHDIRSVTCRRYTCDHLKGLIENL